MRKGGYEVTLRIEPRAAESLRRWRKSKPDMTETDSQGWLTLRVSFEDEEQACFVALGFGPRAEVLAPETLRQRVAADLQAARELLGAPASLPASPRD